MRIVALTRSGSGRYLPEVAQTLWVAPADAGKKLESFLKRRFPVGYVRKLFRKNGLRLNGRHPKAETPLCAGDRLELFISFESKPPHPAGRGPKFQAVKILFENSDLLVIDKPAGMVAQEARGVPRGGTLAGFLESLGRGGAGEPRLVHRLDKDTSGVLVAAKHPEAAAALEEDFEEGEVDKQYLCLVAGRLPQNRGTVDLPLPGREGTPVRAVTHYQVEKRFSEVTLVRITTETGRMHQIRLHFARIGYPVVLDQRHGDFAFNRSFRKRFGLKRQFLHAARLTISYRGKKVSWSAPLAEDLRRTLQNLSALQPPPFNAKK